MLNTVLRALHSIRNSIEPPSLSLPAFPLLLNSVHVLLSGVRSDNIAGCSANTLKRIKIPTRRKLGAFKSNNSNNNRASHTPPNIKSSPYLKMLARLRCCVSHQQHTPPHSHLLTHTHREREQAASREARFVASHAHQVKLLLLLSAGVVVATVVVAACCCLLVGLVSPRHGHLVCSAAVNL